MNNPAFWILLASCILSIYYSACHLALRAFSRARFAELLAERRQAGRVDNFLKNVDSMLLVTGTLRSLLNMVTLLSTLYLVEVLSQSYGLLGDQSVYHWHILLKYFIALIVSGVLVSVFSVSIPTSLSRYSAERLLAGSMRVLVWSLWVFGPFIAVLHLLDPLIRVLTGGNKGADEQDENPLTQEVMTVVEERGDESQVNEQQKEMLEAVFELPSITAGEIMTPRTDMQAIEVSAETLDEVRDALIEKGRSRLPVYEESIDKVLGFLYAKDVLKHLGGQEPFVMRHVIRDAVFVPESKPIRELLAEFKARNVHVAIVLDEYGGTAGLVTIEDIIEQIVGDIKDEHEPPIGTHDPHLRRIDPNTVEVDARMNVNEFNAETSLEVPVDDAYDTVGGFVLAHLGRIPDPGESFEYRGMRFTVTDANRMKVNRLRIARIPAPTEEPARA